MMKHEKPNQCCFSALVGKTIFPTSAVPAATTMETFSKREIVFSTMEKLPNAAMDKWWLLLRFQEDWVNVQVRLLLKFKNLFVSYSIQKVGGMVIWALQKLVIW